MENTKENRINYLRSQFSLLGKRGDLESAGNKLNEALIKKRQVRVISKWSEFLSELSSEFSSELRSEGLWSELWSEFWSELWSELSSELSSEFLSEFSSEFSSELWSELRSEFSSIFEFYENNWILFINEFYPQLKVLQRNKNKIEAIKDIVNAGNAYIFMTKKTLYLLPFPEVSLLDKRLHNETQYALKFADKETYWLHGIKFDRDLWFSVVQRKMTFKEVMGLINIEQRMATLKVYGAEKLLEDSNAILISKSGKGNELFLIDGVFSQPAYFLKYACPSTERVYVSGVDPEIGKTHDPDECMAWKYSITKEEYLGLMES